MPLTLITGPANSGKTELLHDRLRDAVSAGGKATLVLPTREDVDRSRSALVRAGIHGVAIVTFPQLIEGLWDVVGDGRTVVRAEQRAALLGPIMTASPPAGLPDGPGVRTIICQLASRSASDPRPVGPGDVTAARLAEAVGRLRARVAEARLVERPEAARALVEMGAALGGTLAVNRFTDLEDWQAELLFGLARADDVTIALTYATDVPATAVAAGLVDRIELRADSRHVCELPANTEDDDTIAALAVRLFSDAGPLAASSSVAFVEAASAEGEAALAARHARDAVDGGARPERVAVAFRNVHARRHHLQAAFNAESLDAEIAYELPLSATGLGRAMRALIGAAAEQGSARDVCTFVGSPYAGELRSVATALDRRVRRSGVGEGAAVLRLMAGTLSKQAGLGDLAEALVKATRRAARGLSSADDARAWNKLAAMLVRNAAGVRGGGAADPDNIDDLRALSGVGTLVAQVLETGVSLGTRDVLGAFEQTTVSFGGSDAAGTVKVVDVGSLRSRRFDVVVLGGLTAHDFAPTRAEPVIGALSRRLGLPAGSEPPAVERQLFYLAVACARKRLVLIRQATNDRGEPIRSSAFWDEAMARFGADPNERGSVGPEVTSASVDDVVLNSPAVSIGRREARRKALAGCAPASPERGTLSDDAIDAIVKNKTVFSPTELETWLRCPYRWFYDRLVRPDSIDVELDAMTLGSLAHALLNSFYSEWTADGPRRVDPGDLPEALARFDVLADQAARDAHIGDKASLADEVAVARAVAKVRRAIERDAFLSPSYVPTAFEVPFGDDEPFLFGDVPVHGRIDRVDFGPEGLMVIDYKSGAGQKNWGSWTDNAVLQLPIYAEFAAGKWRTPIAGAAYRSLADGCLMGFTIEKPAPTGFNSRAPITDTQLDELLGAARENAKRAASGIRAGDIERRPLTKDACAYCGLEQVCGR